MIRSHWLTSVFRVFLESRANRSPRAIRQRKPSALAVDVRVLESRTLLSGLAGPASTTSPALSPVITEEISDGAVIQRTRVDASQARTLSISEGSIRPDAQLSGNGLQFNLVPAAGMSQQAIDGFQAAADLWSAILRDDIIVNIDIDFTALGAGILGSTGSTSQGNSLTSVKNALTADAKSLWDASAVANLPSASSLSIYTSDATTGAAEIDNNGTGNNNTLDINTANAKALGLLSASNSASDGSISFSTSFSWDFDRSDGISSGAFDFVGVAAHEIGHLLGFVSGADTVDYASKNGSGAPLELDPYRVVSTLDLFRYSADSESAGTHIDLRADTATKYFSIDGGTTQLTTFSTGVQNGDGRQCSHWKDNLNIGIMDPTAANGEYTDITNLDVQAFDVMGWDVAMDLGDSPDTGAGSATGNYATNLSDNGARHMLFSASGSINDPTGAPKVYLGAGVTGELAALQNSTATGDTDNGISSIPALVPGQTQNFTVTSTGNNAVLNYFFDFNRNGSFADAGESFTTTLTATSQSVSVTVPSGASLGTTFARFRISTAGGLASIGPANDGEVEDYQVTIGSSNTAPTLGGAASNQAVNDTSTISPFSTLTVTDPDTQAMSAIIRITSGATKGDFTSASAAGWTRTVNGFDIQYARTFSSGANIGATVQTAIRNLVFQPRSNAIKPNTTETTAFTVTVTDGVASPATNTGTSVVATSVNDAPSISGANASVAVNDNATTSPFSDLIINDADTQEALAKITVYNGVVRGDFTNAVSSGWTRTIRGNDINYVRYFNPGANVGGTVQTAYRSLIFQPRANAIAPGTTERTDILISMSDGVAAPITDFNTRITTTSANDAPIISNSATGQTMSGDATKNVFSTLTITDPDTQDMLVRVTIPNGVNRGDFTSASATGWTRTVKGIDIVYNRYFSRVGNIGGTAETAVRALVFQPRSGIPVGTSETTGFAVLVNDGMASATNSATSVITTGVSARPEVTHPFRTIFDQDIATVIVPSVKSSVPSLLARLQKKSR